MSTGGSCTCWAGVPGYLGNQQNPSKAPPLIPFDFYTQTSRVALVVKNPSINAGDKDTGLIPWVTKIPWRRAWQSTPVFLPGEAHGDRSLAGYSPLGQLDTIEVT